MAARASAMGRAASTVPGGARGAPAGCGRACAPRAKKEVENLLAELGEEVWWDRGWRARGGRPGGLDLGVEGRKWGRHFAVLDSLLQGTTVHTGQARPWRVASSVRRCASRGTCSPHATHSPGLKESII